MGEALVVEIDQVLVPDVLLLLDHWERVLARLFIGELDTALTSDPAYPTILVPGLFGPGRGCWLGYSLGNRILHLPVTLRTRQYCFLVYSVLGAGISYALAMPMSGEPDTALTSDPAYPATLIPGPFGPGRGC